MSAPNAEEHLVFVYGTLKLGQPNESTMLDKSTGDCRFFGKARTTTEFPLIIASRFNIPFLLRLPGVGYRVEGDVFAVDDKKLALLDEFEVHPAFYQRELQVVEMREDGSALHVWIYLLPSWHNSLFDQLSTQMFSSYDSLGEHGRPYIARYLRQQAVHGVEYAFNGYIRGRQGENYQSEDDLFEESFLLGSAVKSEEEEK